MTQKKILSCIAGLMICFTYTASAKVAFSYTEDCIVYYADDQGGEIKVTDDNWGKFKRRYAMNLKLVKKIDYYGNNFVNLDDNGMLLRKVDEQLEDILDEWRSCID